MEGKKISQLIPDTSPSTDDFIVTVDGTTMQNKRVDLGNLPVSNPTNALKVSKSGDTMTGRLVVPSTEINGVLYLSGLGFPNGVVSAPVGSTYTDSNATNGAIEWKKASGTGNTGWVVSVGDTGWLDITHLIPSENTTGGKLEIKRKNDRVYMRGTNLFLVEGVVVLVPDIASTLGAFIPPQNTSVALAITGSTLNVTIALNVTRSSTTVGITHAGSKSTRYWAGDWPALEQWPITLP